MRKFFTNAARVLFVAFSAYCLRGMTAYRGDAPVPTFRYLAEEEELAADAPSIVPAVLRLMPEDPVEAIPEPPADDPIFPREEEPEPPAEEEPAEELPRGDIFAFMYHDLTLDESQTTAWTTTPDSMRSDLEEILAMGYLPLSVEDYLDGNYKGGQDYFIVTFDDGYESNLTLAEPLLREMGIPATVFVITGMVGHPGHMTWEQVVELDETETFSVYSHTHSHMNAEEATTAEFLEDATVSWETLCEYIAPVHKILSFPNGDYTTAILNGLVQDGWELFTLQNIPWWYEEGKNGIWILNRMNVAYNADMEYLVEFSRKRNGFGTLEEKYAQEEARRIEAERIAEEKRLAEEAARAEKARQALIAARQARLDWKNRK